MDENQAREAARNKYLAAITNAWTEPDKCPVCGSNSWNLADLVEIPVRILNPDLIFMGARQGYVYAPITCLTCGYTIFFHTGVLDKRETERGEGV